MKYLLIVILSSAFTLPAFAAKNSITGSFGMERGAFVIGAEFERRSKKTHALSAFFLYSGENAEINNNQYQSVGKFKNITVGGGFKMFLGHKRWNFYLTPGFGVTMVDYFKTVAPTGIQTETTFGPIMRTGAYYRFSKTMAIGLDYTIAFNWFSDVLGSQTTYSTASLRYSL